MSLVRLEEASKARFIDRVWSELEKNPEEVMVMVGADPNKFPSREVITKWVDSGAADKFLKSNNFNWQKFTVDGSGNGIPLYVSLISAYLDYVKEGGSNKEKKQIQKEDPVLIFENNNKGLKVVHEGSDVTGTDMVIMDSFENDNWIFVVPMTHKACVFMDSFECGGQGAKWCIGQEDTSKHWEGYTRDNHHWFVMAFNKDPYCKKNNKKYMIELMPALLQWDLDTLEIRKKGYVDFEIWNQKDDSKSYSTKKSFLEKLNLPLYDFLKSFYKNIMQNGESEYLSYSNLNYAMFLEKIRKRTLTAQDIKEYSEKYKNIVLKERQIPLNSVQDLQDTIMTILRCMSEVKKINLTLDVEDYSFCKLQDGDLYLDLADFNFDTIVEKHGHVIRFEGCYFNSIYITTPNDSYIKKGRYESSFYSIGKVEINDVNYTKKFTSDDCTTITEFLNQFLKNEYYADQWEKIKKYRKTIEQDLCKILRLEKSDIATENQISKGFTKVTESLKESSHREKRVQEVKSEMRNRFGEELLKLEEASKARFINTVWDELEDDPSAVMAMVGVDANKFPSREEITKWVDSGAADKFLKASNFNWQRFVADDSDDEIPLYVSLISAYLDYKKAGGSNKERRRTLKEDPVQIFENNSMGLNAVHEGSDLSGADMMIADSLENKEWLFVIPLSHKACVFMDSFDCGGQGAKWCIGQKNEPEYWKRYTKGHSWFVMAFNKDPFCKEDEKKYMLELELRLEEINIQTKTLFRPDAMKLKIWDQEDSTVAEAFDDDFNFSREELLAYFIDNVIQPGNNRYTDCITNDTRVIWKIQEGTLTPQDLRSYPAQTALIINPHFVPLKSVQELQDMITKILHCIEESGRRDILLTVNCYDFSKPEDGDFYLNVDVDYALELKRIDYAMTFKSNSFNNVFIETKDLDFVDFDEKYASNDFTKIVINGKNCTRDCLSNSSSYPLSISGFLDTMLEDGKDSIKAMIKKHRKEIEQFLCEYFRVDVDEEINEDVLYEIFASSEIKSRFSEGFYKDDKMKLEEASKARFIDKVWSELEKDPEEVMVMVGADVEKFPSRETITKWVDSGAADKFLKSNNFNWQKFTIEGSENGVPLYVSLISAYLDYVQSGGSNKEKKQVMKEDPVQIFKNNPMGLKVIHEGDNPVGADMMIMDSIENEEWLFVVPLTHSACVFMDSFECGGQGAKWCIGQKDDDEAWKRYLKQYSYFALAFNKDPDCVENKKKYMLQFRAPLKAEDLQAGTLVDDFNLYIKVWDQEDTEILKSSYVDKTFNFSINAFFDSFIKNVILKENNDYADIAITSEIKTAWFLQGDKLDPQYLKDYPEKELELKRKDVPLNSVEELQDKIMSILKCIEESGRDDIEFVVSYYSFAEEEDPDFYLDLGDLKLEKLYKKVGCVVNFENCSFHHMYITAPETGYVALGQNDIVTTAFTKIIINGEDCLDYVRSLGWGFNKLEVYDVLGFLRYLERKVSYKELVPKHRKEIAKSLCKILRIEEDDIVPLGILANTFSDHILDKLEESRSTRNSKMRLEEASKERFIKKIWSDLEVSPDDVMSMTNYQSETLPEAEVVTKWVDSGAANSFLQKVDFNWQNFAAGKTDKEGIPLYVHLLNAYFDYKKAGGSRKEKKRIMKEDPVLVFENNPSGLKVVHEGSDVTGADIVIMDSFETDDWMFVVPMNHKACIFMDSFDCGGQGAKWCIGTEGDDQYWKQYTVKNKEWFVMAFNKEPDCADNEKKFMLQIQPGLMFWDFDTLELQNQNYTTCEIWDQTDNTTSRSRSIKYVEETVMKKFNLSLTAFMKSFYKDIIQKGKSEYLDVIESSKIMLTWKIKKGTLTAQDFVNVKEFVSLWSKQVPLNSVQELQDTIMMILRCAFEAGRTDLPLEVNDYSFSKTEDNDLHLDLADFTFDKALKEHGYVLSFCDCDFNNVYITVPNDKYIKNDHYSNFDFTKLEINGVNCTRDYVRWGCDTITNFLNVAASGPELKNARNSVDRELVQQRREDVEQRLCKALKASADEDLASYKITRAFGKVCDSLLESRSYKTRRNTMRLDEASKERFIKKVWPELEKDPEGTMDMTNHKLYLLPSAETMIKWVDSGAANSFLQKSNFNWQNFVAGKNDENDVPLYVTLLNAYFDYKEAGGSNKEKKKAMYDNPVLIFENNPQGLRVVHEGEKVTKADMVIMDSFENDKWMFVVPMTYKACVFMDSFECGGQGAKWCIGYEKTSKYWRQYTDNVGWFVMAFNKDPSCEENNKKYMLKINTNLSVDNFDNFEFDKSADDLEVAVWNQEDKNVNQGNIRGLKGASYVQNEFGLSMTPFLKSFYKNILQNGNSRYKKTSDIDYIIYKYNLLQDEVSVDFIKSLKPGRILFNMDVKDVEELQTRILSILKGIEKSGRNDLYLEVRHLDFSKEKYGDLHLDLSDLKLNPTQGFILQFTRPCSFRHMYITAPREDWVRFEGNYDNSHNFIRAVINGKDYTEKWCKPNKAYTVTEYLNCVVNEKEKLAPGRGEFNDSSEFEDAVREKQKVFEKTICSILSVDKDDKVPEYQLNHLCYFLAKGYGYKLLDESRKQNRKGMIWDFDSELNEKKTVRIQFADDDEAEEFKSEMKNRFNYPEVKSRYAVVVGKGKTGKAVYIENKLKGSRLKEEVYIAEPEQPMQMYIIKEDYPDVFYAYIVSKKKRYGTLLNAFVSKYGYKVVFAKPEMCAYAKGMPTREANDDIYIEQQVDKYNMQLLDALRGFLKAAKITDLKRVDRRTIEIPEEVGFLNKQLKRRKFQESEARALSKKDICLDLSDIIRDIMEGFDNSTSNIHLYKGVKVDYWGTKVAWISGGLNGSGEWSDYLNDLADFIVELEDRLHTSYAKNSRVNVVDVITDPADDVFDVLISITVGESFDETESLEWHEENYADSLDDVKFEWDKEVADWVFYDHEHLKLS